MQDLLAKASSHDFGSLAQHSCLCCPLVPAVPTVPSATIHTGCGTTGTSAPLGPQGHLLPGPLCSPRVETMLVPVLWVPQPHGVSDSPPHSSADRQMSLHCHCCLPTTTSQSAQYGGCPTPSRGPRAAARRALQTLWGTPSCLGAAGCHVGTGSGTVLLPPRHGRVGHIPLEGDG